MRPAGEDVEFESAAGLRDTPKALLVQLSDKRHVWVPKSQISEDSEVYAPGHTGSLLVSEWWCSREGLEP